MRDLKQWFIIIFCLFAGNCIAIKGVPIPGNVLGMLLLLLSLIVGIIEIKDVEKAANILIKNLALFLIPGNVALIAHGDLLGKNLVPILGTAIVTTLIVLGTTGHVVEFICKNDSGDVV